MLFRVLADLIVVVHFAFVVFVVLGGLLVIRRPSVAWVHLPAVVWGVWIEFSGWICPLTPLENHLRARSGGDVYDVSFVERYLMPVLYPESLARELQVALGAFVIIVNAVIYIVICKAGPLGFRSAARRRRRRER